MKKGISRAEENRKIRAESIREQLAAHGHIQHVVDISNKLKDLDIELDAQEVNRLKAAADIKMKIVDKYLPSLQSVASTVEITEKSADELSDQQLQNIATGSSPGASTAQTSTKAVH